MTSIAFAPDNVHVATGEQGKRPSCFIIDSTNMQVKKELKGNGITNSILSVQYSPSGNFLGIVGGDQEHTIAIYNTQTWACVTSGRGDRATIVDMAFMDDTTWVTTGIKHFKLYTLTGNKFAGRLGNFNKLDQRIAGCEFNGNDCLTGNIHGDLYKWQGNTATIVKPKLHERYIDAITVTETHILTGGRDSKINVLSKTYDLLFSIDTSKI